MIEFVRSTNRTGTTNFNFDCTDCDLLVFIGTGLSNSGSPNSYSGLTYNSVALTRAVYLNPYRPGAEIWYLANPTTGLNLLALTSGWPSTYHTTIGFKGVDTSDPLVGTESNTGSPLNSDTLSTLTDTVGGVSVIGVSGDYGGDVNYTWSTQTTELYDIYNGSHDHNAGTAYALNHYTRADIMAFAGGSGQSTVVGATFRPDNTDGIQILDVSGDYEAAQTQIEWNMDIDADTEMVIAMFEADYGGVYTSASVGGEAMTLLTQTTTDPASIWYKIGPTTGSSKEILGIIDTNRALRGQALTIKGMDETDPWIDSDSTETGGDPLTVDSWLNGLLLGVAGKSGSIVADDEIIEITYGYSGGGGYYIPTAYSTTLDWDLGDSFVLASLRPAGFPRYDAQTYKGSTSISGDSVSHTGAGGANRYAVFILHRTAGSGGNPPAPTTVTYDSVPMTQVGNIYIASHRRICIYVLKGFNTGTKTVAWTSTYANWYTGTAVITFDNVASHSTVTNRSGTGTSATSISPSMGANDLFIGAATASAMTPAAGQGEYWSEWSDSAVAGYKTGSGVQTLTWTMASMIWVAAGVVLEPYVGELIVLDALTMASSIPDGVLLPGAVTPDMDTLTLASAPQNSVLVPGTTIHTMDELTLASTTPNIDPFAMPNVFERNFIRPRSRGLINVPISETTKQ